FRKLGERGSRVAESEGSSFRRQTRTRFSLFRSQSSAGTRSLVRLSPANQDRSVLAHRVLWLVCSSVRGFLKFRSGRYRRHYAWHRRENVFVSSAHLSALYTRCSQGYARPGAQKPGKRLNASLANMRDTRVLSRRVKLSSSVL